MNFLSPMLASATSLDELVGFCSDDAYAAEQKVDGHRLLMHIEAGEIVPVSRSRRVLPVRRELLDSFATFAETQVRWVFDGEYLNGVYYVFDLPEAAGLVTTAMPYAERRAALTGVMTALDPPDNIRLLPVHHGNEAKAHLALSLRRSGGEGVILRQLDAPYVPRRSLALRKFKFRNEIDCVVTAVGTKGRTNVSLIVYDGETPVSVGECTALAGDGPSLSVGDVVTVLYLYATPEHRLVQPTRPLLRNDKARHECQLAQLAYVDKTVHL